MSSLLNTRYITVAILATANLFLFQNCSNYSASLTTAENSALANKDIQQIADSSPALNDNVTIQLDHVLPTNNDTTPTDITMTPNPTDEIITNTNMDTNNNTITDTNNNTTNTMVDLGCGSVGCNGSSTNIINNNEHANQTTEVDDNHDTETDDANVNNHENIVTDSATDGHDKKKTPKENENESDQSENHHNMCSLLGKAGEQYRGLNVVTLTAADEGKSFTSHGKTIYVYDGVSNLNIKSINSKGKTIICGNIVISNLNANGNCHLIHAQALDAVINGNLTTAVLDDEGIDKEVDHKAGKDVKSCHVGSDGIIKTNE